MALWPLDTNGMEWEVGVNSKGARTIVSYTYTVPGTGDKIKFMPEEIWHLKDMIGPDGVSGMSRIEQCKNTIGLSLSAEEYGAKFFANDATPAGILKYPGFLEENVKKGVVKSWDEIHKGSGNSFKTALMEGGIDFAPITMKNEDAQFIQTRSFQVADICRIFRVPTIMVGGAGEADKSNTYASAEQQMLSFVQNTIRPWAVRIETNISTNLLDEKEREKLFAEFKLEGLLRGDIKTRYEAYKVGREWGWLSVDDVRMIENLDPLGEEAGGTEYIRPMNYQKLGEEPEEETEEEPVIDEPAEEETPEEEIPDGE
jgi:HK97 family phage portal protein